MLSSESGNVDILSGGMQGLHVLVTAIASAGIPVNQYPDMQGVYVLVMP